MMMMRLFFWLLLPRAWCLQYGGVTRGGREQGGSRRQARVAQLVRVELSKLIQNPSQIKTKDRVSTEAMLATSILDVNVSPDLRSATATVTTRGDTTIKREAFSWLVRNEKSVRYALAAKLKHTKRVPEVRFRKADVSAATDLMAFIDSVAQDDETVSLAPVDGLDLEDLDDDDDEDELTPEEQAFFDSMK